MEDEDRQAGGGLNLPVLPDQGILELFRIIVNYCGPVLMGCKPAALFTLQSQSAFACLSALLPKRLSLMVLRKKGGRLLVLLFRKEKLEKTLLNESAGTVLAGMGYPTGGSVLILLKYLKKQFESSEFPHEIGLFLGYPVEDVLGFVRHKGRNYKLCGYWKVYGDVEQAKLRFRQYDACRERIKSAIAPPSAKKRPAGEFDSQGF
jgi:hypothetical protein